MLEPSADFQTLSWGIGARLRAVTCAKRICVSVDQQLESARLKDVQDQHSFGLAKLLYYLREFGRGGRSG